MSTRSNVKVSNALKCQSFQMLIQVWHLTYRLAQWEIKSGGTTQGYNISHSISWILGRRWWLWSSSCYQHTYFIQRMGHSKKVLSTHSGEKCCWLQNNEPLTWRARKAIRTTSSHWAAMECGQTSTISPTRTGLTLGRGECSGKDQGMRNGGELKQRKAMRNEGSNVGPWAAWFLITSNL